MEFNFTGLVAAPFTPMKENGDIDATKVEAYARHLAKGGVKAVFVNGTTGEGVQSLSLSERKELLEAWVHQKDHCPTIMAQVSGCSFRDTLELTKHAESLGVAAIGVLPNLFPRPRSVGELVDWCRRIGEAAPKTPLFYYHIPGFSGVSLPMAEFLQEGGKAIPTLAGIKYSSADFGELAQMLAVKSPKGKAFKIFHGSDETFTAALGFGIDSAVGSTYNFMPQVFQRLQELHSKGDIEEVTKTQEKLTKFFKNIFSLGFGVSALKPVMRIVTGLDLGPTRYPWSELGAEKEEKLHKILKESGLDLV